MITKKLGNIPLPLSQFFASLYLLAKEVITPELLFGAFGDYYPAEDKEVLDMCLGDSFDAGN